MKISKMTPQHLDACVDLFIEVFTKEPWNDTYTSREQVVQFWGCTDELLVISSTDSNGHAMR